MRLDTLRLVSAVHPLTLTAASMSAVGLWINARDVSHISASMPVTALLVIRRDIMRNELLVPVIGSASINIFLQMYSKVKLH